MIKTPLSTVIGGAFWTPGATVFGGASKTLNQIIKSLFANNEQGFAYDPNDLSTMFQDTAGTVPVTAAGQPVGLMLDKSKSLNLGEEKIPLPLNFNDWTKTAAVTATTNNSFTTSSAGGCTLPIFGSNNTRTYQIRLKGNSTAGGSIRSGGAGSNAVAIPIGNFDIVTTNPAIAQFSQSLYLALNTAGTLTIDSISVKEVMGNHAYQTTSASRPILRQNATTGAYYLEFDGSDDFLVTNNIDFTSTDKVSVFAGVRKLSDATIAIVSELSADSNTNNGAFMLLAPLSSNKDISFRSNGTVLPSSSAVLNLPAINSYIVTAQASISTDFQKLTVNAKNSSIVSTDQGTGNYGNYPLYIGRRAGLSFPFNGHIYSLIGVGRLTTDDETIALEKELAKRTGVTLNV